VRFVLNWNQVSIVCSSLRRSIWACLGFPLDEGHVVSEIPLNYNRRIFSENVSIFEIADEGIGL
jgi:hypothetical protein